MLLNKRKLINEMAKHGFNSTDLAKASNLSDATICLLLKNKSFGSCRTLGKVAKALNVEPQDLIQD